MNFILIYQHIKIISCGKYIQIFKCVFKLNDVCKHHTTTRLHTDLCTEWRGRRKKAHSLIHWHASSMPTCSFSVLHWTIHRYFTIVSARVSVDRKLETVMNCTEWETTRYKYDAEVEVEIHSMRRVYVICALIIKWLHFGIKCSSSWTNSI